MGAAFSDSFPGHPRRQNPPAQAGWQSASSHADTQHPRGAYLCRVASSRSAMPITPVRIICTPTHKSKNATRRDITRAPP